MRMQLSQQAADLLGQSELVIITERVDDVGLLIGPAGAFEQKVTVLNWRPFLAL
jgi:hypothetical protein